MFAFFTSYEDYLAFISLSIAALNPSQSKKMAAYSDAIVKLKALNLDPLMLTLPPLGSYYALINRLWLRETALDKADQKKLYPFSKGMRSELKAPGKHKKLLNAHPDIVRKLSRFYQAGHSFSKQPERLPQELLAQLGVLLSLSLGLIDTADLMVSGDGTCVHAHTSSLGHKVCACRSKGICNCSCHRSYSDCDTTWGWDSSLDS